MNIISKFVANRKDTFLAIYVSHGSVKDVLVFGSKVDCLKFCKSFPWYDSYILGDVFSNLTIRKFKVTKDIG